MSPADGKPCPNAPVAAATLEGSDQKLRTPDEVAAGHRLPYGSQHIADLFVGDKECPICRRHHSGTLAEREPEPSEPQAWRNERDAIVKALRLEWDEMTEAWWLGAEPGPIQCASLADAVVQALRLADYDCKAMEKERDEARLKVQDMAAELMRRRT